MHNDVPLIFLTTTNSSSPTGRNARAQARADSARHSNPISTLKGTFGSFSLGPSPPEKSHNEEAWPRKRRRRDPGDPASARRPPREPAVPAVANPSPVVSIQVFSSSPEHWRSSLILNVDLEDVLKVAAFHIKRTAAQTLFSHPDRALDALRCRQWCSVSSTFASLGRTAYLDSAIACVVSKVQQVVTGGRAQERMLSSYANALHDLRAAILCPASHDMHNMLATTQLLAVYEMLDFPNNGTWTQHVAGAAAMAKMQQAGSVGQSFRSGQFIEALLNSEPEFFASSSCKTLLQALVSEQEATPDLAGEISACFAMLGLVFADAHAASQNPDEMDWSTRHSLLSRAHEVRVRVKRIILRNEGTFVEYAQCPMHVDMLGMFLVTVMMLDRLILSIRPRMARGGHNLQDDTKELCAQLIRLELDETEARPGKELLRAFQRQGQCPFLTYGATG